MGNAMRRRAAQVTATVLLTVILVVLPGADAALAAAPTISSFSPASGPVGTSVTIHGHNFSGPNVTSVTFNGTSATFTIDNAQKITATVPSGATTGPIAVTSTDGTATSSTNFTVTTTGAPTITSFNPTSGPVGTSVQINGTNFTGATAVRFNGVSATTFTVQNATRINATVPSGATTGPISVTTPSGTATSSTNFTVTGTGAEHDRTVSLSLSGHIKVSGNVNTTDGTTDCESKVGVRIQKQKSDGSWKTLTRLQTNTSGGYKGFVPDKVGKYRARVPEETLLNGVQCGADNSGAKSHKH
jgi:IPT/TIG domain